MNPILPTVLFISLVVLSVSLSRSIRGLPRRMILIPITFVVIVRILVPYPHYVYHDTVEVPLSVTYDDHVESGYEVNVTYHGPIVIESSEGPGGYLLSINGTESTYTSYSYTFRTVVEIDGFVTICLYKIFDIEGLETYNDVTLVLDLVLLLIVFVEFRFVF
jgi:hypothetical protein